MLLGGGKDEYCVCGRLLEGLEEGIEGRLREHMDLVYDEDRIAACLRRNLDLLHQGLDILDTIVGSGVKLVDAVGAAFLERQAGLAFAARLHILPRVGAVDGLGEESRRAGLADATRAAKQIGVRQLPPEDGISQGAGDIILTDKGLERVRTVLAR